MEQKISEVWSPEKFDTVQGTRMAIPIQGLSKKVGDPNYDHRLDTNSISNNYDHRLDTNSISNNDNQYI